MARNSTSFKDTWAWQFGDVGQRAIAEWLRVKKGWTILPIYDIESPDGKGPRLFLPDGALITPDILAYLRQRVWWIEAKHKTTFSWYRKDRVWTTGIDTRHYEQYLRVREHSPWPIWLLFLHSQAIYDADAGRNSPTGLFGNEILTLQQCVSHRSDRYARGMIYWTIGKLQHLATLAEVMPCTA